MPDRPTAADERPAPTRAERRAALRRLDGICLRAYALRDARRAAEAPTPDAERGRRPW